MQVSKTISKEQTDLIRRNFQDKIEDLINKELFNYQKDLGITDGDSPIILDEVIDNVALSCVDILKEQLSMADESELSLSIVINDILNKKFNMVQYSRYLSDMEDISSIKDITPNDIFLDSDDNFYLLGKGDFFFVNYYNLNKIQLKNFSKKSGIIIYNVPNNAEIELDDSDLDIIYGIYGANIDTLKIKSNSMINLLSCDIKNLYLQSNCINHNNSNLQISDFFMDTTVTRIKELD